MPASIVVPDASALPHKWQRVKRKQQLEREVCRPLDICQTSTRHCFSEWQTVCPFRWRVEDEAALPMPDDKKVCIGRLFSDGTSGQCHADIYTYLAMSTKHPADVSQLTYILAWSTAHINVVSLNGTSGRCHADIYTYLAMSTRHPADVSRLTYILAWSTAHINAVSLNGTSGRCHADICTYLAMSTRYPADVSQLTYILAWSTAHINVVSLNGMSG